MNLQTSIQIRLPIESMTCSSCVARVEKALAKVPGVSRAEVNLATEMADVALAPGADPETLVAAVRKAGYETHLVAPEEKVSAEPAADRSWWPVAISALLTVPLVVPMVVEPFFSPIAGRDAT